MKRNGKAAQLVRNVESALLSRHALLQALLDPSGRDIDKECGYPLTITKEQYRQMYDRMGVARRVVACLPEECWALDPDVYETEDPHETEFEQAWSLLLQKFNIYHYLHRIDELSGIGQYGILLIGIDDGLPLDQPVEGVEDWEEDSPTKGEHNLLYLRAFDESVLTVKERETDISSPRYSQPTIYTVNFQDVSATSLQATEIVTRDVHWTRAIHVADGRVVSEVYGTPRMQVVYNRLLDIRKILSGSAEMFWKGAFPGFSFEVNPELADQGIQIDATAMREEFEAYTNGLQRYLALTGLSAKSLAPQVVDPSGHLEAHLREIAVALSIPFRILFGSEQAQLASSQDARTWTKRVRRRQTKYVEPNIIRPFVNRLVAMGILPKPAELLVDWPDLAAPSEADKAQVATVQTQALAAYVGGGVDQLIQPASYLTQIMGMDQNQVDEILQESQAEEPLPEVDENGNPIQMPGGGAEMETGAVAPGAGMPVAFNGAQVQAAAQIIKDVAAGEMPRESGIGQLEVFFNLTPEQAERVMGTAGTNVPVKANPGLEEEEPPVPPKGKPTTLSAGGPPRPFAIDNFDPNQPRDEQGRWVDEGGGELVRDEKGRITLAGGKPLPPHLSKIRIPPAWTNVRVNLDPNADLLVKGTDAKGRVQPIYAESHHARQAQAKFERVKLLDQLDRKVESKINKDKSDEAAVLRLVRHTGIRPGSDADTGAEKQAYGATTLEGRHVKKGGAELHFVGKKGVDLKIPVKDPELVKELKARAERAGPKGKLFDTDDSKLRSYVKSIVDRDFKPKDFRTLKATRMAMDLVERGAVPKTDKEYKRAVKDVAKKVSTALGNTPSIALKSYINPAVFTKWRKV